MEAILVFDAGRNRCRASYVAHDGSIIASTESGYATGNLADWVEQEPRDWYFALYIALKALLEKAPDVTPVAISLTGQSRLLFLVGESDRMDVAILGGGSPRNARMADTGGEDRPGEAGPLIQYHPRGYEPNRQINVVEEASVDSICAGQDDILRRARLSGFPYVWCARYRLHLRFVHRLFLPPREYLVS